VSDRLHGTVGLPLDEAFAYTRLAAADQGWRVVRADRDSGQLVLRRGWSTQLIVQLHATSPSETRISIFTGELRAAVGLHRPTYEHEGARKLLKALGAAR
jgi:hypothetical protein